MKKQFTIFLILLCIVFPIYTQEEQIEQEELDFEIEEGKGETSTPFFDILTRNLSGNIVVSRASGSYGSRLGSQFKLQYGSELGNWGKIQISARYRFSEITLNLRLKKEARQREEEEARQREEEGQRKGERSKEEKSIVLKSDSFQFQEAYIDANLTSFLQISVGNKLVAFGQFEIFSPVDILSLPNSFNTSSLTASKLDNRLSQQTLQLNLYPNSNIEIQYYTFPQFAIDPLLDEGTNILSSPNYNSCLQNQDCGNFNNIREEKTISPAIENQTQTATRILFYPNWGNFGLTHHRGYGSFGIISRTSFAKYIDNSTARTDDDYIEEREEFVERNIYGLEFSIPRGSWNWKIELAYNPAFISGFNIKTQELHCGTDTQCQDAESAQDDFIDWIRNNNNNNLSYEGKNLFTAFGVDADLSLWKLNLSLFYLINNYGSNTQKGIDLFTTYQIALGEDKSSSVNFFPSFNIIRYWNQNKTTSLGFLAGIIPFGVGGSFYFVQEYFESLTFLASFESIQYNGDDQLLFNELDYESLETLSTGLRVGLGYNF